MNSSTKNKNNLPSGIKCCIKKCQKSKRHFKGLKMFKFPSSDMILGRIWREKCRIPEKDFNKNLFICENHFSSSYVGKKKLKADAIPTVNMHEMEEESDRLEFVSEQISPQNQESAADKPSSTGGNCTKRTYDQANILEDLEKEEHNLIKFAKVKPELDLDPEVCTPDGEDDDTDSQMSGMEFLSEQNSAQNQESADDKTSSTGENCTNRSYDQANFLEDIEKEEQNLTKSARLDILRTNDMINVGDSNFNFLLSLFPQMEKMNELQNLKFRAKITNAMFDIMSDSSSQNANSNN